MKWTLSKILATCVSLIVFLSLAGRFLIVESKLQEADVIVALSGNDESRLRKAAELYKAGLSSNIMLTNTGRAYSEYDLPYTMLQVEALKNMNIPEGAIFLATFKAKNTGQEGTGIIEKMFEMNAKSAIIVTDPWHTRRVKLIFSDSFANTGYILQYASAGNERFNPYFWWLSTEGWRAVSGEYIRMLGYLIKRSSNIPDYPKIRF